MHISTTALLCYGAILEPDEASLRPTRDPPPGRADDWMEAALLLAQDRDRIAAGMTDIVVRRLFTAGLALESALGLMDGHPGVGKVQEAIGQLDLAIRDVRNVVFDHHQPGPPSGGRRARAFRARSGGRRRLPGRFPARCRPGPGGGR
jgi:signal transduction histidine kinase